MLTLYPSLHIKGGASAYLPHSGGDLLPDEPLKLSPMDTAKGFEKVGFPWLHLVDLDATFAGASGNGEIIEKIIDTLKIPVQISGGMRTIETIERWIDKGAASVVIASAALNTPELVRKASAKFPGKIVVKIDSIGGFVTSAGWANPSTLKALDLALRVEDMGAAKVIFADITSEGTLSEINLETTTDLAFALKIPIIAAGGVDTLQDLAAVKSQTKAGITGIILGQSLYTGALDAKQALALVNA